jgi:hypothetical protein
MAKRSEAQQAAVSKAGRVSGERRAAAAKRRRDVELREGQRRIRCTCGAGGAVLHQRGCAAFED